MRKNLTIPDGLMRRIEEIRYRGRYPTDTKVIMELLKAAAYDVSQVSGFTYLASGGKDDLLKIGYSANPVKRMKQLAINEKSNVELLFAIEGGRLMEKAAHVKFGELRKRGEWFKDSKRIRGWFNDHPMLCDIDDITVDKQNTRTSVIPVRFSEAEKKRIEDAASKAALSLSSFIRMTVLGAADV